MATADQPRNGGAYSRRIAARGRSPDRRAQRPRMLRPARPIASSAKVEGYRFVLGARFDALRQRFHGRVREAKLTPAAIEVLSVVAYRQPIGADDVAQLRGGGSHAVLNQLVRRGLLSLERTRRRAAKTDLSHHGSLQPPLPNRFAPDLPSSEDLDDH